MKRLTLVAGGEENDDAFLREALAGDFWCADRGYLLARRVGRLPSFVIGDLDSLTGEHIAELESASVELARYPAEKDESDLELAVRVAHERGYQGITLIGLTGGRLDHALFNLLAVLSLISELGLEAVASSSHSQVRLLGPGEHRFPGVPGALCSLLALSDTVEDVHLEGLQYLLTGDTLRNTQTRGLSNVVAASEVAIRFARGRLLVVLPAAEG
ncbi:unnamed protein product [Phaeothamnion confervicola]